MGDQEVQVTVWLRRKGFSENGTPTDPLPMYEVVRTQNTISPRVMDVLEEDAVADLIMRDFKVNIG